jgi:hypothetical protein
MLTANTTEKLIGRSQAVSQFEKDLFPRKTLYMALKLVTWVAQENKKTPRQTVSSLL